jgi:integrase
MSELAWSRKKKDSAPRGIFRRRSGAWAIRFTCGAGHVHEEQVGRVKAEARDTHASRRLRARSEPGWCPALERHQAAVNAAAAAARERARISFGTYATNTYLPYSKLAKRSWRTDESRIGWLVARLGNARLDEVTAQTLDGLLAELRGDREPGTVNRYRDLLSAIFKRALRDGHVTANPVKEVGKLREPAGRIAYLLDAEEHAVLHALPQAFRPHFLFSIHTGLRYGEQMNLRWKDVDMLTGLVTVTRSKNGHARQVPMNSVVRSVLMDVAARRRRPNDPGEYVFDPRPVRSKSFFDAAVDRGRSALRAAGADASRLEGYVWHSNRHTFASRLVMAGVDLRTLMELCGWRSLAMAQRYAHLAPGHKQAAVERLVRASELRINFDWASERDAR